MMISATRCRLPPGTATRGPRGTLWEDQSSLSVNYPSGTTKHWNKLIVKRLGESTTHVGKNH